MSYTKPLRMFGLAATLLGTVATQAFALPANEVDTTYYSDATFTQEVGERILACQGGIYREGKVSRFVVSTVTPCHTSGPIEVACLVDGRETYCPPNICDSELFECQ